MKKSALKKPETLHFLDIDYEQGRLSKIIALQRQNDIISMILEGKESREIRQYLVNKYKVTSGTAQVLVGKARDVIKERKNYEINNLISLHVHRYEKIYTMFYELGAYSHAANALKAKEKLLGFHKEGFHMKVSQGEIQQLKVHRVTDEYDLRKLEPEKQVRFEKLFYKMKKEKPQKKLKQNETD